MQSIDSMQSLANYQWHFFHRTGTKNFNLCENAKDPE